jgi:uncharacterized protein (DUF342 family)
MNAALQFSEVRRAGKSDRVCPNNIKNNENGQLQVVHAKELSKFSTDKVLVCQTFETKPLSDFKTCNFDVTLPAAVSFGFMKLT